MRGRIFIHRGGGSEFAAKRTKQVGGGSVAKIASGPNGGSDPTSSSPSRDDL